MNLVEIFANHTSNKGLVARKCKKTQNSTVKKKTIIKWTKTLSVISLKKIYRRQRSTWKDTQLHFALGKCKLSHNEMSLHICQNGWNKKYRQHRMWVNCNLYVIPDMNEQWYSHSGKQLGSFLKTKRSTFIWFGNCCSLAFIPKIWRLTFTHKSIHKRSQQP